MGAGSGSAGIKQLATAIGAAVSTGSASGSGLETTRRGPLSRMGAPSSAKPAAARGLEPVLDSPARRAVSATIDERLTFGRFDIPDPIANHDPGLTRT
jgi:hypothetical protein